MTKQDMAEQIEFALSELADVQLELRRIDEARIDGPRPGELHAESVARTLGRCQEIAHNAELFLSLAVDNLRQCLIEPKKPIAAFFATRTASTRTSDQNLASQPNSNADELYKRGLEILKGNPK